MAEHSAEFGTFLNADGLKFDINVLNTFRKKIYKGFDVENEVEPTMWKEIVRIMNEAAVEGISDSRAGYNPKDADFYNALRHSNEVFSTFKVHTFGVEMAAKLFDSNGNLRSFDEWTKATMGITSHQVGSWLETEYNTAVIRAHQAADWQEFVRNKDIFPNLRWMMTTSPDPEESHKHYWMTGLTLPIDDPFWNKHYPGDRWNCKCSLEATDDPVVRPADIKEEKPQRGLDTNPGKTGELFSNDHPYFPHDCSHCFAKSAVNGKNGTPFSVKNAFQRLFLNAKKVKEPCGACPYYKCVSPADNMLKSKFGVKQKHEIFSRPLEEQFIKVAPNVKRHILKSLIEEDYNRVFDSAKIYAQYYKAQVMIMPEIHEKEKEIRLLLSVPHDKKIPDLKIGETWIDVKSPLKAANIVRNANKASEQGAIVCITDDSCEIKESSLEYWNKKIWDDGNYTKNEVHFIVKGKLYKYNSQGRIPG